MTASALVASSAGDAASVAPASTTGLVLAAERFQTETCVAGLHQPLRDRGPHLADAGDPDVHLTLRYLARHSGARRRREPGI